MPFNFLSLPNAVNVNKLNNPIYFTLKQGVPSNHIKIVATLHSTNIWQVLALLNAANNSCCPTIVEYTEFYNIALDHTDLMKVILTAVSLNHMSVRS